MKEYIVTCKSKEDLDSFYDDMETVGGSLYIPDRVVELTNRRTISRNTHYMLTESEAEEVRKDSRVEACELTWDEQGIEIITNWKQTGDFEKIDVDLDYGRFIDSNDKNWGLYRVNKGSTVSNWGTNGSFTEISNRDLHTTWSGKNVDVVIVDDYPNPNHPEFAVNVDGTGGSRCQFSFNWFQYKNDLGYNSHPTTFDYTKSTQGHHGSHTAGTTAGNTQGWARDANIYTMGFSYTGIGNWAEILWDYVRHFHKNKPINTSTGRRNPTVCNNSWGGAVTNSVQFVTSVTYRGTTTDISSMTTANKVSTLRSNGCPVVYISGVPYLYRIPVRSSAMDADIQDAIADGVILVGSAGNSRWNCESSGGQDYNNSIVWLGSTRYHSRGSSPGSGGDMICVGSIGAKTQEYKSNFSNWGGRVDIWAPGSNIVSAVYSNATRGGESAYEGTIADPRNSSYYIASISGTSMSGPQVAGLLACLCEQEPNLTQAEALQYLKEGALADVGDDSTTPEQSNNEGFGDSNNRYLFDMRKRPLDGMTHPAVLHKNRNTTTAGIKYPRVRNNKTTK